jgi:hypothetical protein
MFIGGALAGDAGFGWGFLVGLLVGVFVATTPY